MKLVALKRFGCPVYETFELRNSASFFSELSCVSEADYLIAWLSVQGLWFLVLEFRGVHDWLKGERKQVQYNEG